ncbi:FAD-dependent monooxygenase [Rickettsia endosymbiont of Cardiosporidium cionae]|uniref:FAD-dependent monooxygenase n=1 Tax=Rickettsia endosymbiont of Cardiosporidium cionae TaxID=2777155 RepID=UPI0018953FC8|nr:FAD-dependent monooxygenase [Rickettsia endosymbiont of Cardiosporidium cionae]KAF8818455.1 2-octaprenyl-6-methoxyphenyl hydroxylase [Rickettsia endosymbiont of Cardiosporidium cionae]
MSIKKQITVLGCGISGMITAIYLAEKGFKVIILESQPYIKNYLQEDIRSLAITNYSKELFEEIGIWGELTINARGIKNVYVVDNKADEIINFNDNNKEFIGYIIESKNLRNTLLNHIQNNIIDIQIIYDTQYKCISNDIKGNVISISSESGHYDLIRSDLTILCDSKESKINKQYFSPMLDESYHQTAITFVVEHDIAHEGDAIEHFLPSGPFAILPLVSDHLSSVVWSLKEEYAKCLMLLEKHEIEYIVQKNFGSFLGNIKITTNIQEFPLKKYLSKTYYNKSLILVGDSAHTIHPLAGQGLNQGIKDIKLLGDIINNQDINTETLELYQKYRMQDNLDLFYLTDSLNKIFTNNSVILHKLRQLGFKIINTSPNIKSLITRYAMGYR